MRSQKFILTAVIALGLCFSVGAATGIKISAELKKQPMKVNGTSTTKEVIAYNNTTYVPLRQVGDMLGVPVDYKDGVIVLGEGESKERLENKEVAAKEEVTKIGDDWILAGTEEDTYFENQKLKAKLYVIDDEIEDTKDITNQQLLDEFTEDDEIKIKNKSLEKIGDLEVVYVQAEVNGEKQLEVHVISEDTIYTFIIEYIDGSDPANLKSELLKAVEQSME